MSAFYPHDAVLMQVLAFIVCLSVHPSATHRYCTKMAKYRIMQTTPRDSPGTCFLTPTVVGGRCPILPEICAQSDPPLFRTQRFRPISAHSTSTVRASEKCSISTNTKSTYHTLFNEPQINRVPKGGTKRDFAVLPVKFKFWWKKSAARFLCVKTSSGKVAATSFLCLTVHRQIACNVRIYLKFVLKLTHLFRKCRLQQISLNSVSAVIASSKSSFLHLALPFISCYR